FLFFVLVLSLFVCAQVGAARHEEADQRLETMLALPVGRLRWLGGRLLLATGAVSALALVSGLATWLGTAAAGVGVSLLRLLEGGATCTPAALLFLGVAALAYAVVPRASAGIAYGLVGVTFLWQTVGSLLGAPRLARRPDAVRARRPRADAAVPRRCGRGDDRYRRRNVARRAGGVPPPRPARRVGQPAYVSPGTPPRAAIVSASCSASFGSSAAVVMRMPGGLRKRKRSPGPTAHPCTRSSRTAAASSASGTQTPSPESPVASIPRAASADTSAVRRRL